MARHVLTKEDRARGAARTNAMRREAAAQSVPLRVIVREQGRSVTRKAERRTEAARAMGVQRRFTPADVRPRKAGPGSPLLPEGQKRNYALAYHITLKDGTVVNGTRSLWYGNIRNVKAAVMSGASSGGGWGGGAVGQEFEYEDVAVDDDGNYMIDVDWVEI